MDYQQMLIEIIETYKISLEHGKAIVFVWDDEDHLREWYLRKNIDSLSLKMLRLQSDAFTTVDSLGYNLNDVCIVAIVLGTEDNNDPRCIFNMIMGQNSS
jgi:hypothetical protein